MVILDVVDEQVVALVMFHCNTFKPKLRFVTWLFGCVMLLTMPLPDTTLQLPAPVVGELAAKVATGELIHNV